MKKTGYICVFSILLLFLFSCGTQTGDTTKMAGSESEYLSFEADLPDPYPEEAGVYAAEAIKLNEERFAGALLKGQDYEINEYPGGKTYISEGAKSAYINFTDSGLTTYAVFSDEDTYVNDISVDEAKTDLTLKNSFDNNVSINCALHYLQPFKEEDLSFMSREDMITAAASLMEEAGIPSLDIRTVYSRDKDTLNSNLDIFNKCRTRLSQTEDYEGEPILLQYEYTEKDEDYLVEFEQKIEDIPVITRIWTTDSVNRYLTQASLVYSARYGLTSMTFQDLYQFGEKTDTVKICSPENALNVFMEDFSKSIHFHKVRIVQAELDYVIIGHGGRTEARPAWVFLCETEYEDSTGFIQTEPYNYVVDAETLQVMVTDTYSD